MLIHALTLLGGNNGTVIAAAGAAVGIIIGVALAIYYHRKRASNV
jgi:membrane associated rhomboid family serine protease